MNRRWLLALVATVACACLESASAQPAAPAPGAAAAGAAAPAATPPASAAGAPAAATAPAAASTPATGPAKPDLARAQQIVTQVCAACHGVEGVSVAPANPHLAGQHPEYVALQLDHFKSGLRKNPIMMAMAANLTADESRSIGAYFASKKPKPGAARDKALAELGQRIYRGGNEKTGVPACSSCHLPTGAGVPSQYPRLAGQFADYTYAQLQLFAKGERGGEVKAADGKTLEDTRGHVMANFASKLSDREMRAVAEYISGLR